MQSYLIETQYFPPISSWALAAKGQLVLEAQEHYQKRSFRNKCMISGPQGTQVLTIPLVKGKHQQQKITDVRIAFEESWPSQHLQAIRSAYGRAPFFIHYFPAIEEVLSSPTTKLFDFNHRLFMTIGTLLRLDLNISRSAVYEPQPDSSLDYRNYLTPRNFQDQVRIPVYPQVFQDRHPFCSNLSILDMLFCVGPESPLLLREVSFL